MNKWIESNAWVLLNILNDSNEVLVVYQESSELIFFLNKAAKKYFNYKNDNCNDLTLKNFMSEEEYKLIYESGKYALLSVINELHLETTKKLRQSVIHTQWKIKSIKNKNVCILTGIDITESKLRHMTSGRISAYLQNLISVMPGNFYWKDKDGYYLNCNSSLSKILGMSSCNEVVGKSDYDLWPEYAKKIRENDIQVMESREPVFFEESILLPGRKPMYFTVVKVPLINDENEVIGILGNSLDITELKTTQVNLVKAKEKAEAANEAKEEFLKNMRHDLRTPFSGMLALADWMAFEETDSQKKEHLTIIADSAKQLLDYLNKVLDQAKQGGKADKMVLAPVNLKKLVEDAMVMIKPSLALKLVKLTLVYADDVPTNIISDQFFLERIVMNLLGNAAKFTEQGEISIEVFIVKQNNKQYELAIRVKDTGIGIPEDKCEVIFEKFTRLDSAYRGRYSGMGLGLHDVKYLISLLGGKITVSQNRSQGAIFTCTCPCTAVVKNEIANNIEPVTTI